ncbi:MAG: 50S ribosomal protein L22 [Bacteroidetes bacterium]|nr:MAG: 50S ribosomal protein L22 [Bacteroidota bacterium]
MEAVAKLKNYPTSPRKMRLLADLIRGHKVERALAILEHNPKHPAVPLRKLVLSAINNWKQKNESGDESELVVKTIFVDGARTLKRMRPAPQGRGYRIRKRSNHVTIIVDYPVFDEEELIDEVEEEQEAAEVEEMVEEFEELAEESGEEIKDRPKKKTLKKSAAKKTKAAPKKKAAKKKGTKKK